jgi:P27 family predicted phage terminase small subunit
LTKEEYASRKEQESRLKGNDDRVTPSPYLSESQQTIFNYIVSELKTSGILSNLDVFVLDTCSIAIDRLQWIESIINRDPNQMLNKELMSAKDKYTKDLYRTANELSLSPQSRAKLGHINIQKKNDDGDPLLNALKRVK